MSPRGNLAAVTWRVGGPPLASGSFGMKVTFGIGRSPLCCPGSAAVTRVPPPGLDPSRGEPSIAGRAG
jgi:hypothetical protein